MLLCVVIPLTANAWWSATQIALPKGSGGATPTPTPEGVIGTTSHTGTFDTISTTSITNEATTTPTTAGEVRYGHVWVEDSNGATAVCVSLNLASDGSVLLYGGGTRADNSAGWVNVDAGSSYTLVALTEYRLTVSSPYGTTVTLGKGGSANTSYSGNNCTVTQTWSTGWGFASPITIIWNNTPGDPS